MNAIAPWPTAATAFAGSVDTLFWTLTGITGVVALGVFVALAGFSIRYRQQVMRDRTLAEAVARGTHTRVIEIVWIGVPLLVFLAFFFWAAALFIDYEEPPPRALEVYVVAKQWMWLIEHRNGRREIDELHVPKGRSVKLVMTSQDVIHSFFVPAFRVKRDVVPGRYTELWFQPTVAGVYHLFCAEYCGTDHSRMHGRIVVMEPEDYARWLQSGAPQPSLASLGEAKFRTLGCSGCHDAPASTVHAPQLVGLYGRTIPLASGRWVTVDERYVRTSILRPNDDVAAGFEAVMPAYEGRLDEQDLLELVVYIKSLSSEAANDPAQAQSP